MYQVSVSIRQIPRKTAPNCPQLAKYYDHGCLERLCVSQLLRHDVHATKILLIPESLSLIFSPPQFIFKYFDKIKSSFNYFKIHNSLRPKFLAAYVSLTTVCFIPRILHDLANKSNKVMINKVFSNLLQQYQLYRKGLHFILNSFTTESPYHIGTS